MLDTDVILKRFDNPDELRTFDKGTFELLEIGGMTIGRATYQPGWRVGGRALIRYLSRGGLLRSEVNPSPNTLVLGCMAQSTAG